MSHVSDRMKASNQNIGFGLVDDVQQDENGESDLDAEDLSFHHRAPRGLDNMDWNDLTDIIRTLDSAPMNEQSLVVVRRHK